MNDTDLKQDIASISKKLDAILESQKKTQRNARWTLVTAIVLFVLPLVGLLFAIPNFLSVYQALGGF